MLYTTSERHSLCISTLINYTKSIRIKFTGGKFYRHINKLQKRGKIRQAYHFHNFQHLFFIRNFVTRKIIIQLTKTHKYF